MRWQRAHVKLMAAVEPVAASDLVGRKCSLIWVDDCDWKKSGYGGNVAQSAFLRWLDKEIEEARASQKKLKDDRYAEGRDDGQLEALEAVRTWHGS